MTNSQQEMNLGGENMQSHFFEHLIDAASMRADIDNLKKADVDRDSRIVAMLTQVSADIKSLRDTVASVPRQIAECRVDMRREVDREFPNKIEAMEMERRIENQIGATDKTLGTKIDAVDKKLGIQIDAVDKKLTGEITDLKSEVQKVQSTVDKQWLKITVIISTVVAVAMAVQWFFYTYQLMKTAAAAAGAG